SAIRAKGLKKYVKGYAEPFVVLFPLNVVGEMAKGVSLAFRLFGNVLGGAIIIVVISSLVRYILLPVGLSLFFGIFVGTIQAFVFAMLSLTYIAVAVND
ncbi:MAG: F0F1 ATP synthase subunit A, partial [Candidatus Latescibacteria bacterium]|nr:F0F1 ATP synthase subunit A [Candidatus Latescibacterota bacterium]